MIPAARLVFPALRWRGRTGFDHERARIDALLELGVGGFIIFGGPAAAVRDLTAGLAARAPHPLLIASDLERGAGQQFEGLTHLPPPGALGFLNDPARSAEAAGITAREARKVGVNWLFAPVADLDLEPDNPIIQTRSFGPDPGAVSAQVGAWVGAAEAAGAAATAKHFPGHGRTRTDSHDDLPGVTASRDTLMREDIAPFRAAVAAGVSSVMTAHVAYPALDPAGRPATLSAPVLGLLGGELGFDGVVVTDALIMEGVRRHGGEADAARAAVAAGCDALLYPRDPHVVARALDGGARAPGRRLDDALARVGRLARRVQTAQPVGLDAEEHGRLAAALADLTLHVVREGRLLLDAPVDIRPVDDDAGGPYRVSPTDVFGAALAHVGIAVRPGGSRIVLVFSEPRSSKGRATLSGRTVGALSRVVPGAALIVLFGHPRLAAGIPGDAPVLCAWHRNPLMQEAAARWVGARLGVGR